MFVGRRLDGTIYGLWTVRQWDGQEELADNSPEVVAFLTPRAPVDLADIDNLDKALKSLALLTRQYANALKAGTFVAKTVADVRADFMTLYRALP
jgi:predicted RNA-binding protein associated with RNAse of E/G family